MRRLLMTLRTGAPDDAVIAPGAVALLGDRIGGSPVPPRDAEVPHHRMEPESCTPVSRTEGRRSAA